MKRKEGRISAVTVALCLVILILAIVILKLVLPDSNAQEFKQIKNYKELERIYEGETESSKTLITKLLTLPMSIIYDIDIGTGIVDDSYDSLGSISSSVGSISNATNSLESTLKGDSANVSSGTTSESKDYSTTNVQVENVDEADVTKTDGNYIYSLADYNIVITDVRDTENAKVVSKFFMENYSIPQEILLYGNKLVAIGQEDNSASSVGLYYNYYSKYNTVVEVFDISDKENPISIKQLTLKQPYYTSRAIGEKVYILSSGYLRENSNDKVDISYEEDNFQKEIKLNNMYYMEDFETRNQTIIAGLDLNNISKEADIKSYFIDLDNAYVSEDNIYIAEQDYEYDNNDVPVKWLFGFGGVPGLFSKVEDMDYDYDYKTNIYKFSINGTNVEFVAKTKDDGQTINQFSMDEYNGNLRVAMYDSEGTRINIYDSSLNKIGASESLAEGEKMYSSRFIGNRAYLVTYKTIDPLFVIDLSDERNPKVLGELKIPGYSTYLHPYDDNHIIGIGMETKETINRRADGTVSGISASIVGMKMALFDVTDVSRPKQISMTVIGDSRTTSAILTNHKALLFSKEKNLIAIPVNNYSTDFEVSSSSENIDTLIEAYKNKETNYIAEGYEVYNIDLEDGFVKKGTITHELGSKGSGYSYRTVTHLLRGMYIEDNLYTVSERMIKINKLDTLEMIKEIDVFNALEE